MFVLNPENLLLHLHSIQDSRKTRRGIHGCVCGTYRGLLAEDPQSLGSTMSISKRYRANIPSHHSQGLQVNLQGVVEQQGRLANNRERRQEGEEA